MKDGPGCLPPRCCLMVGRRVSEITAVRFSVSGWGLGFGLLRWLLSIVRLGRTLSVSVYRSGSLWTTPRLQKGLESASTTESLESLNQAYFSFESETGSRIAVLLQRSCYCIFGMLRYRTRRTWALQRISACKGLPQDRRDERSSTTKWDAQRLHAHLWQRSHSCRLPLVREAVKVHDWGDRLVSQYPATDISASPSSCYWRLPAEPSFLRIPLSYPSPTELLSILKEPSSSAGDGCSASLPSVEEL